MGDLRLPFVLAQVSVPEILTEKSLIGEIALMRDASDERNLHAALKKH
jgi:hypothetical protein